MGFKCTLSNWILILFTLKRMLCLGGNICMKAYDVTPFQILFPITNVSADGWDFPPVSLSLSPGSIVYLGMMFGAFFWGGLSDKVGRKQCLLISMTVNGFFAFLSSFVQGYSMFLLCRMVSGFGWVRSPFHLNIFFHPSQCVSWSWIPIEDFSLLPFLFLRCLVSSKHMTRGFSDRMNKPILVCCGGGERTKQKQSVSRN